MTKSPDTPSGVTRRDLLRTAGATAGVALAAPIVRLLAQAPAAAAPPADPVPPLDPSKVPGLPSAALNARATFEAPGQTPLNVTTGSTLTPLHKLRGTITPADLHFQRHHNGIAIIDPAKHTLTVHGLVEKPLQFTIDELQRFPAVTRTCFIECAGNGRSAYRTPKPEMSPQDVDGMTSNSEWTGVAVKTLLNEAGVKQDTEWVLAEGNDAAELSRSIPMGKMLDDAIIAYAQNGEALRPANGYPIRLVLPGYEGNMCIKWLRRLKVLSEPNMSRDETSKYTDPLPSGKSRQFSFLMDAKSIITSPAYPAKVAGKGWLSISGIAWSGRGRISRVEVSTDSGKTWNSAELIGNALPAAHTRFQMMWEWKGQAARIMSRAVDETGYVQPTVDEFKRIRGSGTDYHFNAIRTWDVASDGTVTFGG